MNAQPSALEAKSHIDWPSWELSRGTPDLGKQACTGDWKGGAQLAIQRAKPPLGYSSLLRFRLFGSFHSSHEQI